MNEDLLSNVQKIFANVPTTRKQEMRRQNTSERLQKCVNSPTYRHRKSVSQKIAKQ